MINLLQRICGNNEKVQICTHCHLLFISKRHGNIWPDKCIECDGTLEVRRQRHRETTKHSMEQYYKNNRLLINERDRKRRKLRSVSQMI